MKLQAACGVFLVTGWLLLTGGCKSSPHQAGWGGPTEPVTIQVERWVYDGTQARKVIIPHYNLHTTIADNRVVDEMAQVMEGAYAQYRKLVPDIPVSDRRMDCYMFGHRVEWESFTRRYAGPAAATYLHGSHGRRDRGRVEACAGLQSRRGEVARHHAVPHRSKPPRR